MILGERSTMKECEGLSNFDNSISSVGVAYNATWPTQ